MQQTELCIDYFNMKPVSDFTGKAFFMGLKGILFPATSHVSLIWTLMEPANSSGGGNTVPGKAAAQQRWEMLK